jgi:hypothetical protein
MKTDMDGLTSRQEDRIFDHLEQYRTEVLAFKHLDQRDSQQNKIWIQQFQERARQGTAKEWPRRDAGEAKEPRWHRFSI